VKPGEYSFTRDSGDLVLSVNRTAGVLSLAVVGQTGGWVGVGVGALEMNGATIFMGFVDDAGQASFKPQAGEPGHTHTDAAASVMDTVISWAVRQTGNTTTLEVALKPDAYITKDSRTLDVIYAIGPDDGFTEYHLDRDFVSLNLDSP
jgi:hypothetical protein